MSSRSSNLRRPSGNLSIFPPSPSISSHPTITTPTNPTTFTTSISSPRRAPLPPSPTNSTYSSSNVPWLNERSRANSLEVPSTGKTGDRRIPFNHGGPPSPHQRDTKGAYAGAYDNKLVCGYILSFHWSRICWSGVWFWVFMQVSSTLSQLPPLPPISPTPANTTLAHPNHSIHAHSPPSTYLHPTNISKTSSYNLPAFDAPQPSLSGQTSSSSGVVVLPNGTTLPTSTHEQPRGSHESNSIGRSVHETLVHSSASSPWSVLTVHSLPLFAGGPLRTPIEDLKWSF